MKNVIKLVTVLAVTAGFSALAEDNAGSHATPPPAAEAAAPAKEMKKEVKEKKGKKSKKTEEKK